MKLETLIKRLEHASRDKTRANWRVGETEQGCNSILIPNNHIGDFIQDSLPVRETEANALISCLCANNIETILVALRRMVGS